MILRRLKISVLEEYAPLRPAGFVDEYLSAAVKRNRDDIFIPREDWGRLHAKYDDGRHPEPAKIELHFEKPLPRDQWPAVIQDMAAVAQDGDSGVGEVYSRNPTLWHPLVEYLCKVCHSKYRDFLNRRYPLL
jgi:hypothetical protein